MKESLLFLSRQRACRRWIVGFSIGLVLVGFMPACSGLIIIKPARDRATPESAEPRPPFPAQNESAQTPPARAEFIQPPLEDRPASEPGRPEQLVSETINLDAPIVPMDWRLEQRWGETVSVWNVPFAEAGWHANSARPGQGSNVVISGHNNSSGGQVFGNLDQLVVGNRLTVKTDQETFVYSVSQKHIVRAFGASQETLEFLQTVTSPTTKEQLTLITCWPNWTNTHRLIVIAQPL